MSPSLLPRRKLVSLARLAVAVALVACAIGVTNAVRTALATGIPTTNTLAYSGQLLTFGTPDNSAHQMSAVLYVGGTQQCATTTQTITCVNGQFTIPLPAACTPIVQNNASVDIQVVVDTVPLGMAPLAAVPYAVVAGAVDATGVTGVLPVTNGGTGSATQNFVLQDSSTGEATLPVGTTTQRSASPTNGMIRYNSTTASLEAYVNNTWSPVGGATNYVDTIISGQNGPWKTQGNSWSQTLSTFTATINKQSPSTRLHVKWQDNIDIQPTNYWCNVAIFMDGALTYSTTNYCSWSGYAGSSYVSVRGTIDCYITGVPAGSHTFSPYDRSGYCYYGDYPWDLAAQHRELYVEEVP